MANGKPRNVEALEISNPNFEDYVGIASNKEVMLANTHSFLRYDREKKTFQPIDSLTRRRR